ncbi:MAG: relaxase/mobilization nuclease domain-containing protein [Epulopiscium sp.]|nr:relaxase/mobilization nuclease domain-containing protein [Candidatus Epulonipiscium sp.]
MAITKIHPIKSTLNLALDYILDKDKTDDRILISSFLCNPNTAHLEFEQTRAECNSKTKVIARHLIQAFLPGEVTPDLAHEIGLKLCEETLKGEYEYVLTTHVDKGHIHNHIVFNNVNFETGKAYQSNKKSYHQIRNISDELCKKYHLSVIDEEYKRFKELYSTKGKSYKEYMEFKKGTSWKYKLKVAIDKAVLKSNSYDDFLKVMETYNYEIKFGKHIAFRHKEQTRFTRAKTIGPDYTVEKIKERIKNPDKNKLHILDYDLEEKSPTNRRLIDIRKNPKVKESKGYEIWANRFNMKLTAETLNELRKYNIKDYSELESLIQDQATKRQGILTEIKNIEIEMKSIKETVEELHVLKIYKKTYDAHKSNPDDKDFFDTYKYQIIKYETAYNSLKEKELVKSSISSLSEKFKNLSSDKTKKMKDYEMLNSKINDCYSLKKTIEQYHEINKERY